MESQTKIYAILNIRSASSRIKGLSDNELKQKIDFVYSLGYIYDPYLEVFVNPFIDQEVSAELVCETEADILLKYEIGKLKLLPNRREIYSASEVLEKNRLFSNGFLKGNLSPLWFFVFGLITSIMMFLKVGDLSLVAFIPSFIYLNLYVLKMHKINQVQKSVMHYNLSWIRYSTVFFVIWLLYFPLMFYFLYSFSQSVWISLISIWILIMVVLYLVKRSASRFYWATFGKNELNSECLTRLK